MLLDPIKNLKWCWFFTWKWCWNWYDRQTRFHVICKMSWREMSHISTRIDKNTDDYEERYNIFSYPCRRRFLMMFSGDNRVRYKCLAMSPWGYSNCHSCHVKVLVCQLREQAHWLVSAGEHQMPLVGHHPVITRGCCNRGYFSETHF